ncbi:hypothetical protein [Aquitalea magnusonii]|uniref:Uncharacterized protein n=1 Tax=Aquitalea magnusonii TaxID=332411 RepID=A0A318JMI0_9NEIS|nr:hypothetical protein [Aquitalea magnusonii]PXX51131.1 hypothetical protein DFR38_101192 [Aquitalea magnusonii]
MAVSFGLAKKIIDHPSYNLGLALPFISAFYILNDVSRISLPLLDIDLGTSLSVVIKIMGVAFYYIIFIILLVLFGGFSKLVKDSKFYLIYPIFIFLISVFSFISQDDSPRFGLIFGVLSLMLLLFYKFDDGYLSLFLVLLVGGLFSLFSFVAGIMWFFGVGIFQNEIAGLFGFAHVSAASLKVVWPMLITTGYVIYYAIFQTGELWE